MNDGISAKQQGQQKKPQPLSDIQGAVDLQG